MLFKRKLDKTAQLRDTLYRSPKIIQIRKQARDLFETSSLLKLTGHQLEVLREIFQVQELG